MDKNTIIIIIISVLIFAGIAYGITFLTGQVATSNAVNNIPSMVGGC